ncbi:MAG: S49 family peptidase, partial [Novosphingobium sp.]
KAMGLPVAVSMGSLAASGGYWVSTPAQRIFAEPSTITGSIGVFAVIPTLEQTLPQFGVTTDSIRTTPLSGQPDVLGGFSPQVEALLQGQVEQTYSRFLGLVAKARGKSPADIDKIAQGRIWDGGTARQLGLVDQFGGLDDAVAWVAKQAKADTFHASYVEDEPSPFAQILRQMETGKAPEARAHDLAGALAAQDQGLLPGVCGGRSGRRQVADEASRLRPCDFARAAGGLKVVRARACRRAPPHLPRNPAI